MEYISYYISPLGRMLLAADDEGLTGLWFEGQRYFALHLDENHEEKEIPVLAETKRWLDIYFSGSRPDFTPPLHVTGSDFHREVSDIMRTIPYGKTMTYGEIAGLIAEKEGRRERRWQDRKPLQELGSAGSGGYYSKTTTGTYCNICACRLGLRQRLNWSGMRCGRAKYYAICRN